MIKFLLLAPASLVLLVGCASNVAGTNGLPTSLATSTTTDAQGNQKQIDFTYETRATLGECPSDPVESAILTAVGASFVAQGVNRIGAAIRAAGKEETSLVVTRRNVELSESGVFGPCLLIARGWFYNERIGNNPVALGNGVIEDAFKYKPKIDTIRQAGLPLAATPDFFFEGLFIKSLDETAAAIAPIYAYLDQPISQSPLRQSTTRNVLVSFAISAVGKPTNFSKGQGSTVILGELNSQIARHFPIGAKASTNYQCSSSDCKTDDEKLDAEQVVRNTYESEWFSLDLPKTPQPRTLQVLVSETRSANEFLTFVADVFGDVKSDLTTEIQEILIPSIGAAADAADRTASVAFNDTYDKAFADAAEKLTVCKEKANDIGAAAAARIAMRALNQAARSSGKQPIFGEETITGINLTKPAGLLTACDTALGSLSGANS